mmetsp:Transcript_5893/g.9102  ORF Transcript_5893/g.9102 Transcript_5893/m.9102 type:complete len:237 (-) Transcript_5893:189-899(-)
MESLSASPISTMDFSFSSSSSISFLTGIGLDSWEKESVEWSSSVIDSVEENFLPSSMSSSRVSCSLLPASLLLLLSFLDFSDISSSTIFCLAISTISLLPSDSSVPSFCLSSIRLLCAVSIAISKLSELFASLIISEVTGRATSSFFNMSRRSSGRTPQRPAFRAIIPRSIWEKISEFNAWKPGKQQQHRSKITANAHVKNTKKAIEKIPITSVKTPILAIVELDPPPPPSSSPPP